MKIAAGYVLWDSKNSRSKMQNYGQQLSQPVRLKEARTAFLADSQNRKCKQHVRQQYFKQELITST